MINNFSEIKNKTEGDPTKFLEFSGILVNFWNQIVELECAQRRLYLFNIFHGTQFLRLREHLLNRIVLAVGEAQSFQSFLWSLKT